MALALIADHFRNGSHPEEVTTSKTSPLRLRKADLERTSGLGCFGPQPDSCTAAKIKIARVGPNVVPKQLHRVDDFICGQNGTGVVRDIDVESGVHLLIRLIR